MCKQPEKLQCHEDKKKTGCWKLWEFVKGNWKLVKGKPPCSQFGSFPIDGKFSSCPDEILSMWFNHFLSH